MRWKSIFFISLLTFSEAQNTPKMLHAHSVEVRHKAMDGTVKKIRIARDSDLRCREVPFDGKTFWSSDYPTESVPEFCIKRFITTAGQLSPMKIDEKIDTYGELEVLEFLEELQEDPDMLFVDSRKKGWHEARTIPGAVNIPFIYFTEDGKWEKKKQEALELLGVKRDKEGYDFSEAKTVLFFCNGVWCRQSPQMIEALLEIGYPPEKMKWYRGGLQSWLNVGMTSIRPAEQKEHRVNVLALIVLAVALSLTLNLLMKRFDVSTIVGYIFTGFIVATFFDYVKIDQQILAELAEFGVVFLMFTIGLEFSLTHMKRMKLEVFVFGILQVAITAFLFTYLSIMLFDLTLKSALVVGMALSLSSTAIVLTTLNANGDIHRPYGRYALGILLFQDVAVIPILLLVSFLAKPSGSPSEIVLGTLFSGFIVIFTLFVLGKYATTKFLGAVVDSKKQELFILAILLIVLSASLLAHAFGFSYSLGAFIAGMLISESKYKYQIEADLVPFRDILLGLFFITVGLQINLAVVWEYFFTIIGLTVAILFLKAIIIFLITVVFSFPKRAFKTALALAQVGEFSFAVFALAKSYALVDNEVLQVLVSVVVVSLIFTSLSVKHIRAFTNLLYQNPTEAMREPISASAISHHILVCGYSLLGQRTVEELKTQGIAYVAIEHDRSLVKLGQEKGDSVFFGNAASKTLLNALDIQNAIAVIIAIDNDEKIRLICEAIYSIDERIDIILKVSDRRQIENLSDLPIKSFINQNETAAKLLVDQALKCDME